MDTCVVPTPYDFAASFGNLELFQMIYQRIEEKNLQELFKESKPFSEAAVHGHYDFELSSIQIIPTLNIEAIDYPLKMIIKEDWRCLDRCLVTRMKSLHKH